MLIAAPFSAGAGRSVFPQGKMAQLSSDSASAAQQLASGHHTAADAGAQRNHNDVPESFRSACKAFSEHRGIGIVQRPGFLSEGFLQLFLQVRSFIPGNFPVRSDHPAGFRINLAAGGHSNSPDRAGMLLQKHPSGFHNRCDHRCPVLVI